MIWETTSVLLEVLPVTEGISWNHAERPFVDVVSESTCSHNPNWCHDTNRVTLPSLPPCFGACPRTSLCLSGWGLLQLKANTGWVISFQHRELPGPAGHGVRVEMSGRGCPQPCPLPTHGMLPWSGSRPRASLSVTSASPRSQWSCAEWNPSRWLCKEIGSFCAAVFCLGYWGCAATPAWPAVPKDWWELIRSPCLQLWRAWGQCSGFVSTWRSNYGWKHPQFMEESHICLNWESAQCCLHHASYACLPVPDRGSQAICNLITVWWLALK